MKVLERTIQLYRKVDNNESMEEMHKRVNEMFLKQVQLKKTFYFSERYHIRTYKNGIEDGIRIVYFWEKDLKAEEY